jgi:hypothetical protein
MNSNENPETEQITLLRLLVDEQRKTNELLVRLVAGVDPPARALTGPVRPLVPIADFF